MKFTVDKCKVHRRKNNSGLIKKMKVAKLTITGKLLTL